MSSLAISLLGGGCAAVNYGKSQKSLGGEALAGARAYLQAGDMQQLDGNGDLQLSFEEYFADRDQSPQFRARAAAADQLSERYARAQFVTIDLNRDGRIDVAELTALRRAERAQALLGITPFK